VDVAEAYMLMFRPTLVPIVGEAWGLGFESQIEIHGWNWDMVNQEEVDRREKEDAEIEKQGSLLLGAKPEKTSAEDAAKLAQKRRDEERAAIRNLIDKSAGVLPGKLNEMVGREMDRADAKRKSAEASAVADEQAETDDHPDKSEDNNLKLIFSKRVDFASTQMLNSMKAGDVFPRVVLTLFHRSVTVPLTLAITMKNVRLLGYKVQVDVSETMADMKEDWEADFTDVSFMYQNRPTASGPKLTQGTARIFTMKSRASKSSPI
jgi:type VI protein secretion system component Hcp